MSAATTLQIEGTVTLASGTNLTLSDYAGNAIVSSHDEVPGAATLVNRGTISGAGTIGDGSGGVDLTLENYGDIAAVSLTGTELILNTGSNAIINESGATLEAQSGGTLEIDSNVTNTGATIKADNGGIVELVSDTVTGGTIALNGLSAATTLQIEGTVTLASGTNLTLSDYAGNAIVSSHDEVPGAATLVNRGTISGAGTIGDGSGGIDLTLENYGDIAAVSLTGTELIINTGSNAIINESGATLEAQSGGTLEIDSNVTNTGATIKADNGGIVELVSDTVTGGQINIDGTVALSGSTVSGSAISNAGDLEVDGGTNIISNVTVTDVGSSSQLTVVSGTLTLDSNSFNGGLITITIEPGATLNVDNSLIGDAILHNLGGTLNVSNSTIETINSTLSGNNTVEPGQTFTLVDELVTGTITNEGTIQIETKGLPPHGVIFDGVAVTNVASADGIEVGVTSTPTFLLEDGATISGGFLTITSGSTLDVERGTSGPGAVLDGVLITNNGVVEVGSWRARHQEHDDHRQQRRH